MKLTKYPARLTLFYLKQCHINYSNSNHRENTDIIVQVTIITFGFWVPEVSVKGKPCKKPAKLRSKSIGQFKPVLIFKTL